MHKLVALIILLYAVKSYSMPKHPPRQVYEIRNIYTGVSRLFYNATKVARKLNYLRAMGVGDDYELRIKTINYDKGVKHAVRPK